MLLYNDNHLIWFCRAAVVSFLSSKEATTRHGIKPIKPVEHFNDFFTDSVYPIQYNTIYGSTIGLGL